MYAHRIPAVACAIIAAATVIIFVACSDSGSDATPPGRPEGPTPTRTPAPPDPKLAERLRYEGDFEGAIDVYGAIAAQAAPPAQQDARLAQAQLLIRTERFGEARTVLEEQMLASGAAGEGSAAQYMLATALTQLGEHDAAIAQYDRYIAAGGTLVDYARAERAQLLAQSGRVDEAQSAAEEVMAGGLVASFTQSFLFDFARALEDGGADPAALAWYQRALTETSDTTSALARIGAVKKRLGDASWTDDYLRALNANPRSGLAATLLSALDEVAVPVGDYVRGVVQYTSFDNDAARASLQRALNGGDRPAEAAYYLGALAEREGATESAIDAYGQVHDIDPQSPLASDALWWRGRLLEHAGRYDEARDTYATIVREYPVSEHTSDAEFHEGLADFREGAYATAAERWRTIAVTAEGEEEDRVRYWQGRALIEAGDRAGGEEVLHALALRDPDGYYALRAEVLLKENDRKARKPDLSPSTPDWQAIQLALPKTTAIIANPTTDPLWYEAQALADAGLIAQANSLYSAIISGRSLDPDALLMLTRTFYDDGNVGYAARAATTLLAALPEDTTPPEDLLRIAYPPAYPDLVLDAADEEDLPPLLLLALVRQESLYDPDAGSVAGALGLTQIVPSTGQSIASGLGVQAFRAEDLFRPKLNLEFGANYLSGQLKRFDEPYYALAAYNGGPGTAQAAIDSSDGDVDLFVEDLEFEETRRYVRRVMEHYARYRQLYEGLDRPSLPR